jgi:hypothetical protein
MYSREIVERKLAALGRRGLVLERHSVDHVLTVSEKLQKKFAESNGSAPLTDREAAFIRNEQRMCRLDFRYWALHYGFIELDTSVSVGGGIGLIPEFWPSQERALSLIGKREEESYDELKKHGFTDGIMAVWHKTRQQFATATMRLITGHRMTMFPGTRAIAASLDEKRIGLLYDRDHHWLDNLPWYLKPQVKFDVKNAGMTFESKSSITYQPANQQAGVGTSFQFDISHMTEVALWEDPWRLRFDFLPTVPKAVTTFVAWESTANGRGTYNFWHQLTEYIRKREEGFERWIYIFTPWYVNANKNRQVAPDKWEPEDFVKEHAELIERTSIEFCGETVRPSKNQLYWWRQEYMQAKKMGTLNLFFTNYPATPEQSFQHSAMAALPLETTEWMRSTSMLGVPYSVDPNFRINIQR